MKKDLTILLLRTTAGKFIFKPWGINKFLLPIFGFLLDEWRGMGIGLLFGFILDMRFIIKQNVSDNRKENIKTDFRLHKLMLGVYTLQVTDAVKYMQFEILYNKMEQLTSADFMKSRKYFLQELLHQRIQVNSICRQLSVTMDLSERILLLTKLSEIVYLKNIPIEKFNSVIQFIGKSLKISAVEIQKILSGSNVIIHTHAKYFHVLGLSPTANYAEVKKAYYILVKKYHPDASIHVSESEKKILVEKFRSIKEAFDLICTVKGWK